VEWVGRKGGGGGRANATKLRVTGGEYMVPRWKSWKSGSICIVIDIWDFHAEAARAGSGVWPSGVTDTGRLTGRQGGDECEVKG
jgi:hypothetical protein